MIGKLSVVAAIVIAIGIPLEARADQCSLVATKVATSAAKQAKAAKLFVDFCQPCGDKSPSKPQAITSVEVSRKGASAEVVINGQTKDLAYVYIAESGQNYQNLGVASGCVPDAVSTSFLYDGKRFGPPSALRYSIKVLGHDDEWIATGIKVEQGDLVVIKATGMVSIGKSSWSNPKRNADGCEKSVFCPKYGTGSGSLVGKLGRGKMFFVGQKYSAYILSGGSKELKLKIRDSKYTDNSGEFDVDLVVIPHSLIPTSKVLTP